MQLCTAWHTLAVPQHPPPQAAGFTPCTLQDTKMRGVHQRVLFDRDRTPKCPLSVLVGWLVVVVGLELVRVGCWLVGWLLVGFKLMDLNYAPLPDCASQVNIVLDALHTYPHPPPIAYTVRSVHLSLGFETHVCFAAMRPALQNLCLRCQTCVWLPCEPNIYMAVVCGARPRLDQLADCW